MIIGSVISATSIFLTSTVLLLPSARTVAKLDVSLMVLVWMRRIVVPTGSRWRILTKLLGARRSSAWLGCSRQCSVRLARPIWMELRCDVENDVGVS
jgi:hypothetical protein